MEKVDKTAFFENQIKPILPDEMLCLIDCHAYQIDQIGCSDSYIYLFDHGLVLKVEKKTEISDQEYQMMQWLQGKLPVPQIKGFYSDEIYNYLLMTKLNGKMLLENDIISNPREMVKLLAQGIQRLWQVDITECPVRVDLNYRLKAAETRVLNHQVNLEDAEPDTFGPDGFENPQALYDYLKEHRPAEELVLSHGDYCLPNVFAKNHQITGFLDLGSCGIADRWQDIALGLRSLRHNLELIGKENEYDTLAQLFFEELGVKPSKEKIRYHILMDELF